jgi:hypothetical protein
LPFTSKSELLAALHAPIQFASFDGAAVVVVRRSATWVHMNGAWSKADGALAAEIGRSARLMPEAEWADEFAGLPLPPGLRRSEP